MIAVVLDTNSVHKQPWLERADGLKLLEHAARGVCEILYPQVVLDELRRQKLERPLEARRRLTDGFEDLGNAGVDVTSTAAFLEDLIDKYTANVNTAIAALFVRAGVRIVPVPDVAATALLERDLGRRRPFLETDGKARKSYGFRDALIWETVLAILGGDSSYESILFVTADKGFLSEEGSGLHPDLLTDLDSRRIDHQRIVPVHNLLQAVEHLDSVPPPATVEAQGTEYLEPLVAGKPRADLVNAATDALYELQGAQIEMSPTYGGDYAYPDFVRFTVPGGFEGCYISDIDQESEFTFSVDPVRPDSLIAEADAVISLEGVIYKSDWYMDDASSVQINGERNSHYFEASSEVAVRVVVEIDVEGDSIEAVEIVLQDRSEDEATPEGQLDLGLDGLNGAPDES